MPDTMKAEWLALIKDLISRLEPEDELELTIATDDERSGWGYQTGDNSFTGGAYGFPHWAVTSLFKDSKPEDIVKEIESQLEELIAS